MKLRWPHNVNFSAPETEELFGTRNLYLTPEEGISIGVWHLLPNSLIADSKGRNDEYWENAMRNSGRPIILYLHGNSGSRAGPHRKELYQILQELDSHVLCLDYRGYADSTQVAPTETGVVSDARALYKYIRRIVGNTGNTKIFVWGHSLGTGVASHMVADLCVEGDSPAALILESPFTNIGEEVKNHMLSAIYRYLPGFDYIFVRPLEKNDIAFQSDRHIAKIDIPIAIFHAIDDPVVPFALGVKLFRIAGRSRGTLAKPVYFKRFGEGFAHKFICRSPDLPNLVKQFQNCTTSDTWPCVGFDNFNIEIE
ncbi:lysophosphatidylserine lipase ABHD12 isoform X2 [Folsomia candida]|uniref:lysophosphatidylserine lipase ABHD12 isoform X2 n=1 Tax=Folsomia candida TaxID=158441 RepID=UPI000B8FE6EB|nr:lysophosphatidylserine lipase ABHD12 isoform X2 [Folsomia candida]